MANLNDPHGNRLEIYRRDGDRKWAWRLIIAGDIVATDAGQGYENLADAQTMAERILAGEFDRVPSWRITDDD